MTNAEKQYYTIKIIRHCPLYLLPSIQNMDSHAHCRKERIPFDFRYAICTHKVYLISEMHYLCTARRFIYISYIKLYKN